MSKEDLVKKIYADWNPEGLDRLEVYVEEEYENPTYASRLKDREAALRAAEEAEEEFRAAQVSELRRRQKRIEEELAMLEGMKEKA